MSPPCSHPRTAHFMAVRINQVQEQTRPTLNSPARTTPLKPPFPCSPGLYRPFFPNKRPRTSVTVHLSLYLYTHLTHRSRPLAAPLPDPRRSTAHSQACIAFSPPHSSHLNPQLWSI